MADLSDQDINVEIEHADEYRMRYQDVKLSVATIEQEERQSVVAPPTAPAEGAQLNQPQGNKRSVKLPKLTLKTFSGELKE